jgi:hypothetical protein
VWSVHLLVAVLLAGTLAQTGAADPDSLTMLATDQDNGSAACGPDQVSWTNMRSFTANVQGSATLHATAADGASLVDLQLPLDPGAKLIPLWCGDVLGDGSQVLGYETFSGGAHCCFSVTVLRLQPGAAHLLDVDLGNGGLSQPRQLDGSGALELVGSSDVFAYFDDLSFAASPFLPLVFAYDGQRYVEATRRFPDLLSTQLDQANAELAEAVARPAPAQLPPALRYQEQESLALRIYGLHVLLGDPDTALADLQARVAPLVASWLAANADAARDAMAQVYDLSSPTSASPSG